MANEFDAYERDLLKMANDFKGGKEIKKFLKKQGRKLSKKQNDRLKASFNHTDTNASHNGLKDKVKNKKIKVGKVYKYAGDWAARSYSSAPHHHLLNDGHRILKRGKNLKEGESERRGQGAEVGFVAGEHFMEKAAADFEGTHYADTKDFIDEVLKKGLT